MQAILYARFSDSGQAQGDSITRQMRTCKPYIEAKGWTLETILTDEGKSGFKGEHRRAGTAFGDFELEVGAGLHADKVLVIEKMNRLSRQSHTTTYDLVRFLTGHGVSIAVVDGDRLYAAYQDIPFMELVELLIKMQLSTDESAVKSDHASKKWVTRREKMAEGKPVSAHCPGWLKLKADRSKYEVIKGRGEIVREIYEWADSGLGGTRIVRKLNERGTPPWPKFAGRTPPAWQRAYIGRLLSDRRVTGEMQPMSEQGDKRVPAGPPILNYYPRVVDDDLFGRVAGAADMRKGVRGTRSATVVNLVSGLARCSVCGRSMRYEMARPAGWVRIRDGKECAPSKHASVSLRCPGASEGICENKKYIAYITLEKALVGNVLHLALDDRSFARRDEVARLDREIATAAREHDILYARAVELWEIAQSQIAQTLAQKKEDEAAAIKARMVGLHTARDKAAGQADAAEHLSRLAEIRDNLYAADLDVRTTHRLKVAQGFRAIIDRIDCNTDGTSWVVLAGGRKVMKIIPGRGRREPTVWDFDLVHPDRSHTTDDPHVAAYLARLAASRPA
jgi:DNA invertase Pin-like site-specific DNA recombinase